MEDNPVHKEHIYSEVYLYLHISMFFLLTDINNKKTWDIPKTEEAKVKSFFRHKMKRLLRAIIWAH